MSDFAYPKFPFRPPAELSGKGGHAPVVVIGAGPSGLTAALDLGLRGVPVVVLDDDDTVGVGSRAICWSKRSLEIFDRLGIADGLVAKGVTWQFGRVFFREDEVYDFDLQPEGGQKMPAFINLQQYYVESALVEALQACDSVDMRFLSSVTSLQQASDGVDLTVATPKGDYALRADYVIAADGAHSFCRKTLDLPFEGKVFEDRFLIADVKMRADFPPERRFWFDPSFHRGGSALLHKQADDVWRIDLQLGWQADPEEERKPERVIPRLKAMLGDVPFELQWVSVYTFQCRRLERFRQQRVFFVGDSAHQMAPFGARGGNGGLHDADNLAWKLALVVQGHAGDALLDSYDAERLPATDADILHSTRSTDFITPQGAVSTQFRDAVLALAEQHAFARELVNSGRLSTPFCYGPEGINSTDDPSDDFKGSLLPGAPCPDAPITNPDGSPGWLLNHLGNDFTLLCFGAAPTSLPSGPVPVRPVVIRTDELGDPDGLIAARYDGYPGTAYLIRPDQHVAARFRYAHPTDIERALSKAIGSVTATPPATAAQEA